ncbi:unnamed protein product [Mortierella alpina]
MLKHTQQRPLAPLTRLHIPLTGTSSSTSASLHRQPSLHLHPFGPGKEENPVASSSLLYPVEFVGPSRQLAFITHSMYLAKVRGAFPLNLLYNTLDNLPSSASGSNLDPNPFYAPAQ